MIWLLCLKMLASSPIEAPPAPEPAARQPAEQREQGTMTAGPDAETPPEPAEAWWARVVRAGADEARLWPFRTELRLPLPQLLATVADVYAYKLVGDEVGGCESLVLPRRHAALPPRRRARFTAPANRPPRAVFCDREGQLRAV